MLFVVDLSSPESYTDLSDIFNISRKTPSNIQTSFTRLYFIVLKIWKNRMKVFDYLNNMFLRRGIMIYNYFAI